MWRNNWVLGEMLQDAEEDLALLLEDFKFHIIFFFNYLVKEKEER